jgi:hypothetical protein
MANWLKKIREWNWNWQTWGMIIVAVYLLILLIILAYLFILILNGDILGCVKKEYHTFICCGLVGGIGGITRNIRSVYVKFSPQNIDGQLICNWDNRWLPWYILRPYVSIVMGCVGYLLLRVGLLTLNAEIEQDSPQLMVYAVAFIAGLKVNAILIKIDEISKSAFGKDE